MIDSAAMDFEDEAEDEEIEETSSVASRVPTPGASLYETDESVGRFPCKLVDPCFCFNFHFVNICCSIK